MRDSYFTRLLLVGSILALTVLLTVTGISSVLDLWSGSLRDAHWFVSFILTPLVAGICAVVCYLLYALISEMFGSRASRRSQHEA